MAKAEFKSGQIINHKLFNYRGVILKVDQTFKLTDEWYEIMAKSKPPKDKPWYHVIVNDGVSKTYVAEQNLETDVVGGPIDHPEVRLWFEPFKSNGYNIRVRKN